MKAWRVAVVALSFLFLSGCLVTFKEPLPASEAAPAALVANGRARMPGASRSTCRSAAPANTATKP